jgi:hypothetical protein
MKTEALHVGMRVKHPQYGTGAVKSIGEHTSEIRFDDGPTRAVSPEASELQPIDAQVSVTGSSQPLKLLIEDTVRAVAATLGLATPEAEVNQLGVRWYKGRLVLHPADPTLQTKEVPVEVFFHKIVMLRNNLRVLEQKINANEKLTDAEKVELQQYITRCYGSMTTFNVLFRNKEDQFTGTAS